MPQFNEAPGGPRVTATDEAEPHRTDPREEEVKKLKKELNAMTGARDDALRSYKFWEDKYNQDKEEWVQRALKAEIHNKKFAVWMAKLFLWFGLVPAWFVLGAALVYLPLARFFHTNQGGAYLAFAAMGATLLWLLVTYLHQESRNKD